MFYHADEGSRILPRFVGINLFMLGLILFVGCDDGSEPGTDQKTKIQWSQANGPNGGNVNTLVVVGDNVLACTDNGIFLSGDNGENWNAQRPILDVRSVAKTNTRVIAASSTGIYISNDNGSTWIITDALMDDAYAVLTTNAGIFVGGILGLRYSADNGESWTALINELGNFDVRCLATNGDRMFAGTKGGGVLVSDDDGQTWTNTGLADITVYTLAVNGDLVFAGTRDGVFVSDIEDVNWQGTSLTDHAVFSFVTHDGDILAGTNNGVWRTPDNGASWTPLNNGLSNLIVNALLVDGTRIYCGTRDGVFVSSDNGQSWERKDRGMITAGVYSLAWFDDDKLFAGTYGTVHASADKGQHWIISNSHPLSQSVRALTIAGNTIFEAADSTSFVSRDGGANWTTIEDLDGMQVSSFLVSGDKVYASTLWNGVFVSTDDGAHWTGKNDGLNSLRINCLAESGDYIFAGGWGKTFRCTNGGDWIQAGDFPEPIRDFVPVYSLLIIENRLVAGTGLGAFVSENNGDSWTLTSDLPRPIRGLAASKHILFAAGDFDVLISTDLGSTWKPTKLSSVLNLDPVEALPKVQSLAIGNQMIAVGTRSDGVFVAPLPSVGNN